MSDLNNPGSVSVASTPKMMSSRLAGMKFMQRANASSKPSTPISEPTAKRIRTDTGYTPGTSATNTPTSEKRLYFPTPSQTQASPLQTYQSGAVTETQWIVASSAPHEPLPRPLATEHDEADSEEESNARQTYGNFKRKRRVTTTAAADNANRGAAYSIRPLSEDDTDSVDEGLDSNEEDDNDMDEDEEDEHANSRAATRRRKAAVMSGEDLDRIDLRQSQYTKSKGTLNPHGGGSSNGNGNGKTNNSNKKVYNRRGANTGQKQAGRDRHREKAKNKPKKGR